MKLLMAMKYSLCSYEIKFPTTIAESNFISVSLFHLREQISLPEGEFHCGIGLSPLILSRVHIINCSLQSQHSPPPTFTYSAFSSPIRYCSLSSYHLLCSSKEPQPPLLFSQNSIISSIIAKPSSLKTAFMNGVIS